MEAGFWHERWERAEIGFHQQEINTHLQQFWSHLELCPGQRVFVPLCGKSLDVMWLHAEYHAASVEPRCIHKAYRLQRCQ